MFIFERRLTVKVVVDRSLFTLWKRQNRVSYHITIILSIVYLVERRSSVYCYYRISKFQLHTIWSDDEILINALNFLLWNLSNLNLYIFELIFIWYFVSLTNKTSNIFSDRLLELSLRIVRKNDHEELLSWSKIVSEATQSKRTFTSDISVNIRIIARSKYFFLREWSKNRRISYWKSKRIARIAKFFDHIYITISRHSATIVRFDLHLREVQSMKITFILFSKNLGNLQSIFFSFQNFSQQRLFSLLVDFHAKCLKNLTISCRNFSDSWISITSSRRI